LAEKKQFSASIVQERGKKGTIKKSLEKSAPPVTVTPTVVFYPTNQLRYKVLELTYNAYF
jgi:hypothetical protein